MSATTITGTCAGCGRDVERVEMPGRNAIAKAANALPLWCDECDRRERAELATHEQAEARKLARAERDRRVGASGLPRTLRRIELGTLDTFGREKPLAAAVAWGRGTLPGLVLTGSFGTGKTRIAAAALWLVLQDRPGTFVSAPELFRQLATGFSADDHVQALSTLKVRNALVLDDLDKARASEYGAEQIFLAIDNAATRGQQLLVTTNLDVGQLAAKWPAPFGQAIASRLAGYCRMFAVAGRDRRIGGAV